MIPVIISCVTGINMSDHQADIVPNAEMKPSSATEKFARHQLIKAQIEAASSSNDLVKAVLGNMSEEEQIRLEVLQTINQYKESTPEWYQLCAMTKGRTDPFDQAEYLAHEIYEAQKAEVMMSYYTPSKSAVRERFLVSAKAGVEGRGKALERVSAGIAEKKSRLAAAYGKLSGSDGGAAGVK